MSGWNWGVWALGAFVFYILNSLLKGIHDEAQEQTRVLQDMRRYLEEIKNTGRMRG